MRLAALSLLLFAAAAQAAESGGTRECRVVSTCPAATEILFDLGAGDLLVGVSASCDFPEAAKGIDRVADMAIDPERILAKSPDLVVVMKGLRAGEAARLSAFGLPVLELDLATLESVARSTATLAARVGRPERAGAFAARLAELERAAASAGTAARPRVYVETWGNPPMTSGAGTFLTRLVELAGGRNVFAERAADHFQVGLEEILAADPEVIVVAWPEDPARVAAREGFEGVAAVRSGRVRRIDPDLVVRPGPRLLDGAARLRELIAAPAREAR